MIVHKDKNAKLIKIVIEPDKLTDKWVVKSHYSCDLTPRRISKSFKTWEGANKYIEEVASQVKIV